MTEQSGTCERHEGTPVSGACTVCGKPICRLCVKSFGYHCSEQCRNESRRNITAADRESHERTEQELAKAAKAGRFVVLGVLGLLLIAGLYVGWRVFLDTTGKVVWRSRDTGIVSGMQILDASPERVLVRSANRIRRIDPDSGEIRSEFEIAQLGEGYTELLPLAEGLLILGNEQISRCEADGGVMYTVTLDGRRGAWTTDRDGNRFYVVVEPSFSSMTAATDAPPRKRVLVCISLETGDEEWRKKLHSKVGVTRMAAGAGAVYALFSRRVDLLQSEYILACLDAHTGKKRWRIDLPASPGWGPTTHENLLLVHSEGALRAFTPAGEERWTVPADASLAGTFVKGGMLFTHYEDRLQRIEPETGAIMWSVPHTVSPTQVVACDKGVVLMTQVESDKPAIDKEKLPPAYEELDDVMKDIGGGVDMAALNRNRGKPALVCIDSETGEERWRTLNVLGQLVGDDKRLLVLMDTSQTSMLEMVSGGKGTTILRQYDPRTGKRFYTRQSEIGFSSPVLAGDRLVGLAYDRTEKPGLMNSFGTGVDAEPPQVKGLGFAAFRVR